MTTTRSRWTTALVALGVLLIGPFLLLLLPVPETPPDATEIGLEHDVGAAPADVAPAADTQDRVWTMTGRVRHPNGLPFSGARVEADGTRAESGADGKFALPDLPWRAHDLVVWADGYALVTHRVEPGDSPDIRMRPVLAIAGTVRRPDGSPVAGIDVTLRAYDKSTRVTTTDADGAFAFDRVVAGRYYAFTTPWTEQGRDFMPGGSRADAGDEAVDVRLIPGVAFVGHVAAPDGSDVEGAEVVASMYRHGSTGRGVPTRTAADGSFRLIVPLEQQCTVVVETPTDGAGYRFLPWASGRIVPAAGALDVQLEQGTTITGRVVAARGVDVAGRSVWACRIAGEQRNAITHGVVRADGTFRIGGLWDASYELRVDGACKADDPHVADDGYRVKSGGDPVELRLTTPRTIGGIVRDKAGAPVPRRRMYVYKQTAGLTRSTMTDENGRFEVQRLPPGDVTIAVLRAGRNQGSHECGTHRAGDVNIELHLDE